MRTIFYLDDEKVTRKYAQEFVGADEFKRMLKEAKEAYMEDPFTSIDFMTWHNKTLHIDFVP